MPVIQFDEYKVKLNNILPTMDVVEKALNLDAAAKEIEELETASERPDFWNDVENSQKVQKRLKQLKDKSEKFAALRSTWEDMMTMCEMAIEENDDSMLPELEDEYEKFYASLESMRLSTLLTGDYDANNAILTFHAGAGGTEAQDWTQMLYRMYNMWADRHGYTVKLLDYLDGDEAGIKSATIMIEGENAYGYLRSENGIHRLVRISPFRRRRPPPHLVCRGGGHAGDHRGQRHRAQGRGHQDGCFPLLRRRRTEGQQNLLGRASHPYPHRHRGLLPGGAQPFPEP
jgi:peptide chain release factor 2